MKQMKTWYRYFLLFNILCSTYFYLCQVEAIAPNTTQKSQQLKRELSHLITQYNLPGAVVTAGFQGEPLQTVSVGLSQVTSAVPMTNDKQFIVGSITKSFIAVAILDLVQKHKITV